MGISKATKIGRLLGKPRMGTFVLNSSLLLYCHIQTDQEKKRHAMQGRKIDVIINLTDCWMDDLFI